MRVVIAPDKFAGTLSAGQAAEAIAAGWSDQAPEAELVRVPMSDGGPGFVEVLRSVTGGALRVLSVPGPLGVEVPATLLLSEGTAYVESAQAIGLHLCSPEHRDPERASSAGLGVLLAEAVAAGASRIVVGLGGSGVNDGGAGMLAALGAHAKGADLDRGPAGLKDIASVDLGAARDALRGIELVAATDVDNPLLGITGATKTFGPQKGLGEDRLVVVDGWLQGFAEHTGRKLATAKGAGAAGGVGFALLLLGADRRSGIGLVAESVGLADRVRGSDLVVTGEGAFDFSSRSDKVPYGVAGIAADALVPCIAVAGRVMIGSREMRALGMESAYSLVDLVGEQEAFAHPERSLRALAARVARTWSW